MAITVKPGKSYVLGGKTYGPGDEVPLAPGSKFLAYLTSSKGPLQSDAAPSKPNNTDLPKAAMPAPEPAPVEDIVALRGAYETTVGKRPFGGWKADELKDRIAAHQNGQTYLRRDMRAAD